MDEIRQAATQFAHVVHTLCPPGRYKSLALTHIEDACMRSIGAVALDQASVIQDCS